MKAIRVTGFGGPEVLTLADVERPVAGNGEVLVRAAAAGVNYMDVGQRRERSGQVVPYTPGGEASVADAAEAHRLTESRTISGKLLLRSA